MSQPAETSPNPPKAGDNAPDISVLVPVLNEESHIRETVSAMQAQQFDGTVELLYADGRSEDRTREILLELAKDDPRIRVLDNPRRGTASALNVCLREARGEFVARMDAHTYYGDRYLAAGVERLRVGDVSWVSGPAVPRPRGLVSRAVVLALASFLGRGGSRKWDEAGEFGGERELDTGVFGGVWRRSTLMELGGWDEDWPINQDSEMAARHLVEGGRIVCMGEMVGYYVPRDSLRSLARQYFRYGYYRARTFRRHPNSMRPSQLIAPALSVSLLGAAVAPGPLRTLARAGTASYLLAVLGTGVMTGLRSGQFAESAVLVVVLPVMHLAWGFGALVGGARFGPPIGAIASLLGMEGAAPAPPSWSVYSPSLNGREV